MQIKDSVVEGAPFKMWESKLARGFLLLFFPLEIHLLTVV